MTRSLNKIKQKQYVVTITETVREDFVIAAHNKDEVIRLAQSLYRSGQLVLEPGERIKVKFEAQVTRRKTRR